MLKNKTWTNEFSLILLLAVLSFSCSQGSKKSEAPPNTVPTNSTVANPPNNKTYDTKVKIKTPDDKDVVEVKIDSGGPKLEYGGKIVRGETKNDKRKYTVEGGSQIAEVKIKEDDGFKVRTNDGKLLWKVKIDADKIKISDNEENTNAFEIKKKDDGAKIERGETRFGEVKFYTDRQKIKVKDASDKELFDGNTDKYSIAYGVLTLNDIPEDLRFIILAELLARNV